MERATIAGDSPVGENGFTLFEISPEYRWKRKPGGNLAELSAKAKYYPVTDSEPVP